MARVIVVTSGKGGVGKTSVCANVGTALANMGMQVCLIDADLGLRNLDVVLGLEGRIIYDLQDVIEGRCELDQAIVKDKKNSSLHILPACKNLDVQSVDFTYLQKVINELKPRYDYIFIDCPAGIERGFYNAIKNAKEALLVATLDISSLRDGDKVIGILNTQGINDVKVILNRVNPDLIENEVSLSIEDALEVLSVPLAGVVYHDDGVSSGNNAGSPIVLEEKNLAGKCFKNIALRLQGEEVERVKYKKKGFFARLLG